jgi:hypothetical protein
MEEWSMDNRTIDQDGWKQHNAILALENYNKLLPRISHA